MSPLQNVPGLAGYLAAQQQNQAQTSGQLQQAQAVLGIQGAMQQQEQARIAAAKEAAMQRDRQALGENPTPEALMGFAAKHSPPKDILSTQTAHADRQAALKAKAEENSQRIEDQRRQAEMLHEFRLGRLASDQEKAAETARHNKAIETLNAQNAATNAELRRMALQHQAERATDAKGRQTAVQTMQLSAALEKAGLPEGDVVLGAVEGALKKAPQIAEYLAGPKSLLPDMMVPQDIREGRQAFQKLFNITLKTRSGAAVTNQELERLRQEFASGAFKTEAQLKAAVDQARNIINKHYASVAAGFAPDVLNSYNENVRQFGGRVVIEAGQQAAPGSNTRLRFDAQGNQVQ